MTDAIKEDELDPTNPAKKPREIVFAPGCFDHFDGTQEELDGLIQHLKDLVATGELEKQSKPVSPDEAEFILEMTQRIQKTRQ